MSRRTVYLVVIRRPLDDETLRGLVEEFRRHQLLAEIRDVASHNGKQEVRNGMHT